MRPPLTRPEPPAACATGSAAVLVVSVRPGDEGLAAARRAGAQLPPGSTVTVSHTRDPRLPALLRAAGDVVVLDPGRIGAALARLRGGRTLPGAPARSRDRLALLAAVRGHAGRVRWVARASQWDATRGVLAARAATEPAR